MKRILVGVDGSDGSRQALAWAIDHAAASGDDVQAVIVWQRSFDYGSDRYWPVDQGIAEDATKRLITVISEVAGPDPAVTINPLVLEGDPGKTLCAESATADLLVVGSRGLGGFAGLVLGSVSTKCAHHSRCPVVIVPPREPAADGT